MALDRDSMRPGQCLNLLCVSSPLTNSWHKVHIYCLLCTWIDKWDICTKLCQITGERALSREGKKVFRIIDLLLEIWRMRKNESEEKEEWAACAKTEGDEGPHSKEETMRRWALLDSRVNWRKMERQEMNPK